MLGTMREPNTRPLASEAVYTQLRDRILTGDLKPGDPLPGERRLSEQLGVNRGAVREGIQRLAQARLVVVQHGGATRVLDYRDSGLDLLADLLARPEGGVSTQIVRGVLELRNALAPVVVRLAARHGGAALATALDPHVEALATAETDADRYTQVRAIWRLLSHATQNLALQLALNSLQKGTGRHEALVRQFLAAELSNQAAYHALADAVRRGDEAAAEAVTIALVAPTVALAAHLQSLPEAPS